MRGDTNTLRTGQVHVFKYNVTNAHRILRMMHNPQTPASTRRALRSALKRIAACTDIDKRQYLKVENVAILLRIGITYREGALWQRAHRAHSDLWDAFNERDRIENPRRWILFDKVMRVYQERCKAESRPRARRVVRPVIAPTHSVPVVQRIAA